MHRRHSRADASWIAPPLLTYGSYRGRVSMRCCFQVSLRVVPLVVPAVGLLGVAATLKTATRQGCEGKLGECLGGNGRGD